MEKYFFVVLSAIVKRQNVIKSVKYETPGEHCERIRVLYSNPHDTAKAGTGCPMSGKQTVEDEDGQITFKVITPNFFARFFHYNSPLAAIQGELLDDERTRTAWCSHPDEFASLFSSAQTDEFLEYPDWRWKVISALRTAPSETNFPHHNPYQPCRGISMIDTFVLQACTKDQVHEYRRGLVRLFLSHCMGTISWPVNTDFELIGLSQDAIVTIHEAFLKTALTILGLIASSAIVRDSISVFSLPLWFLALGGLNCWACLKSIF